MLDLRKPVVMLCPQHLMDEIDRYGTGFLDDCREVLEKSSDTLENNCRSAMTISYCFAEAHNWSAANSTLQKARVMWCANNDNYLSMLAALHAFLLDATDKSEEAHHELAGAIQKAELCGSKCQLGLSVLMHALCTVLREKHDRLDQAAQACTEAWTLYYRLQAEYDLPEQLEMEIRYEKALLHEKQGRFFEAFTDMRVVIKYDSANGRHDLWYDVPILARLHASLGNASQGLDLFDKLLPAGPPDHLPEVSAFYHLTRLELLHSSNRTKHGNLEHLQAANSSLRRAGHIDEARCPLSMVGRWHDKLSHARSTTLNQVSGQVCGWTSGFFRCCD